MKDSTIIFMATGVIAVFEGLIISTFAREIGIVIMILGVFIYAFGYGRLSYEG